MSWWDRARKLISSSANKPDQDESYTAIVVMLRRLRSLPESTLQQVSEKAWGVEFNRAEYWPNIVVGGESSAIVKLGKQVFTVRGFAKFYGEQLDPEFSRSIPDPRCRRAWTDHSAFLSLDYIRGSGSLAEYKFMARFVAELLDDDCTGVLLPALNSILPNLPGLTERLRNIQSLDDFSFLEFPIIQVEQDDPEIAAAVTEARARWPEFWRVSTSEIGLTTS
jgi:hypothetical protein